MRKLRIIAELKRLSEKKLRPPPPNFSFLDLSEKRHVHKI